MKIISIFVVTILALMNCVVQSREIIQRVPVQRLSFVALGQSCGRKVIEYDVTTADGYILKLFRIPGDWKPPVLLMHGVVDSADTFILRGNGSLAISLAEQGYDVWLGNSRGSRYSRKHLTLNPDVDKHFWDFSYHEIGYYDLPAFIDFILHETGRKSLSVIGHSQGNTIFYVLGSTRPTYNEKINVLIAISPVCFFNHAKPPIRFLISLAPIINKVLQYLGQEEISGDNSATRTLTETVCGQKNFGYTLCAYGIFFLIGGRDADELEPEFFSHVVNYYPTGTSRKNLVHLYQNAARKSFAQFNYGPKKNLDLYKSAQAPTYDLGQVKMKVAMLFGGNDGISNLKDVSLLCKSLPNVVEYRKINHKMFNHLDAVWGRNMKVYLFPHIFDILVKYNTNI